MSGSESKMVYDEIERIEVRAMQRQIDLLYMKNSAVCGHLIVGWAMAAHMVAYFQLLRYEAVFGVVFAVLALAAAWLTPSVQPAWRNTLAVWSAAFTAASWAVGLWWALK